MRRRGALRAYKLNRGSRVDFLYDGELRIAEINADGSIAHDYGYGLFGLVQRHFPQDPTIGYKASSFDPDGNPVNRWRQVDSTPQDIAVYDSFGMLHGDISANSGLPFPEIDPIGPNAQWGAFVDEETRTSTTTGLMLGSDGSYYDPSTGRKVSKRGGGYNPNLDIAENALTYAIAGVGEGLGNWIAGQVVGAVTPSIPRTGLSPQQRALADKIDARVAQFSHPFAVGDNPIEKGFAGVTGLTADSLQIFLAGSGAIRSAGEAVRAGRGFGGRGGGGGEGLEGGGGDNPGPGGPNPSSRRFNPFRGMTPEQVDKAYRAKGYQPRGPDPVSGKGGYVNPRSGRSIHIDPANSYGEPPHVDVNRPRGYNGPLRKRKFIM